MKTIHEYFALTEDEYTVTILSYYDINKEDYLNLIQIALQKYDLREYEIQPAQPFSTNPVQFPTLSFGTLYKHVATIGNLPRGMYEQLKMEISQTTRIPLQYFFLSEDGEIAQCKTGKADDEALLTQAMGTSPRDFPEDDLSVQKLVGQQSVEEVLKNMDDRKKAREEESRAVTESIKYKTSHTVLSAHTGKPLKRGIYEFSVVDGDLQIGACKNDLSEGVYVKDVEQLLETLKPVVPTFAQKYKLEKYLKEDTFVNSDIREHINHMIALFEQKNNIVLKQKDGFSNHTMSASTIDCALDENGVGHVCVEDDEVQVKVIQEIGTELNWDNVMISRGHSNEGLCIKFEWQGDI